MRKTFITLLTILGIAAAHAEDYPYMMFQTNDGTILTMASASLTITFVEVFTITGIFVGKYENVEKARTTLERGIYVVKNKNHILKIAVQ